MGRTEFRPETDYERALVGMAEPSTRAKWRAFRSARSSTLKKCLTLPTLLETTLLETRFECGSIECDLVRRRFVLLRRIGLRFSRHLAARSASMPASDMSAAVRRVALLLTGAHSFPLFRRDDGIDLLTFPLMNLLDLLPLLLDRER